MFSKDNIFADYKKQLEEKKAASVAQQKLMGMAHAYNKGELPDASDEVKQLAKDMKKSSVKDMASTKHKGLPDKVAAEEDETEIDDEEQDSEEESEEEQPSGPSPEEIELEREKVELEKARMKQSEEEAKIREAEEKKKKDMASKYPEGSTWFCSKVNKKVKVLSTDGENVRVGNGSKKLVCKPSELSAVKEDVSLQEKGKGLWANIHAKRKRGEPPAKPGDPDYPETLDIEDVDEDNPCWDGYKKVPGKKDYEPGSCEKEEVEEAGYMDQPKTKAEVKKKDYDEPEGDSRDTQLLKVKEALKEIKIKKLDKDTLDMLKSLDPDEARLIIQGLPSSLRRKAMKELGLKEKVDGRTSAYKETVARLMAKKEVKEDVSPDDEEEFHKKLDDLVHDTFGKGDHEKEMDESTKEYAKTLQALADKAKKEKITPKDLATLDKLADMMKKANEGVELGEKLLQSAKEMQEAKKVTDAQIHKVLGPTKNAKQGIEALKKAFKVSDKEAEAMLQRVLDD